MNQLYLRDILILLVLSFTTCTILSQELIPEQLLEVVDQNTEQTCLEILGYYKSRDTRNPDSLRKYANLLIGYYEHDDQLAKLAKAKSYLIIAEFRSPFTRYEQVAKDLIQDYKSLSNYQGVVDEQYYLANKAHMSGISESFDLYQEGLEYLQSIESTLVDSIYCKSSLRPSLESRLIRSIAGR